MHEELISVVVAQTKNVADEQALTLDIGRGNGDITQCHSIELLGYTITGTAGSVPPLVVLSFDQTDSVAHYVSLKSPSAQFNERIAYVLVYPPGGAVTESRYRPAVLHRADGGYVGLANARLTLKRYDATASQFVAWNDWTTCALTLQFVRMRDSMQRKV
jgi:hypothetical protein